jgi:putative membrane protein
MALNVATLFSKTDLDDIAKAVAEAESHTSGEIVPFVVDHCDGYEEAELRGALLCAAIAAGGAALALSRMLVLTPFGFWQFSAVIMLAGIVGWGVARYVPFVKRIMAGHRLMERRVAHRAAEAFVSEEVFATKHRTGILIFVALFERRVIVIGDSGINAKVERKDWDEIIAPIVSGISSGTPAKGLMEGIRLSGQLLARHGVNNGPDDADELPNSLRIRQS